MSGDWLRIILGFGVTVAVVVLVGIEVLELQAAALREAEAETVGPPGIRMPGVEALGLVFVLGASILLGPYILDRGLGDRS